MLSDMQLRQLQDLLPKHIFPQDNECFLLDQRRRYHSQAIVVQPENIVQIQQLMCFCVDQKIALIVQGGNTGLVGGTTTQNGIIVNLSKLNKIRDINLADNSITVEAGCVLQQVQQAAKQVNRFFPLSLASEGSCQIGGNIACNAGGLNVLRYGTMRDLVLGLEVLLPNGEVISHLNPLHKNTTGYELKHLFIGSEGTLGIITAATLKLFAPSKTQICAWVGVENINQAIDLLKIIRNQFAERLCSFELMSQFSLALSSQFNGLAQPTQAKWHVLLELADSVQDDQLHDKLSCCLWKNKFENSILSQSEQERQYFWRLRENISAAQRSLGSSIKHDIAMPIAHIANFIHHCAQDLQEQFKEIQIVVFGHLGDGSLHYNVFIPDCLDNHIYEYEHRINTIVYKHVLENQGTIAAEHGIGRLKTAWLSSVRTRWEIQLMQTIKNQVDPCGILNPNVLFE